MRFRSLASVSTLLASGLLVSVGARAQEAPTKIAFVHVQRALALTEEGKARGKELQDWARPQQEELQRLDKELGDLENQMNSARGAASEDKVAALNRTAVAKKREFEDKQRAFQRAAEQRQGELLKNLGEKLQAVITEFSDKNRYTAVFIINDSIAYLANSADITDEIVKLYNQKHPLGAAAPKPAAPGK